ncbi:hypothetical protein GCM10027172_21630 [Halomonas garicola]
MKVPLLIVLTRTGVAFFMPSERREGDNAEGVGASAPGPPANAHRATACFLPTIAWVSVLRPVSGLTSKRRCALGGLLAFMPPRPSRAFYPVGIKAAQWLA